MRLPLAVAPQPLVSIIIPTHNRAHLLPRALASVKTQTFQGFETIIVDDASTDHTREVLESYPLKLKVLKCLDNQGAAQARNLGIQQAQGELIAFLDSDDVWELQYLASQVKTLQRCPQAVLAYTDYVEVHPGRRKRRVVSQKPQLPDLTACFLLQNFIHSMSQVVVRAAALEQSGGLDSRLTVCHDKELYLRLVKQGGFVHLSHPLVQKIWTANSLMTQDASQEWQRDGLRLLDIFFENPQNAAYQRLRPAAEQKLSEHVRDFQRFFAAEMPSPTSRRQSQRASKIILRAARCYEKTDDLWVITSYFNPEKYVLKRKNYQLFKQSLNQAGLNLLTVESALSADDFELEHSADVIQILMSDVMWQKERLLNLAIAALPQHVKKVAWLDCDVLFVNAQWAVKTAELLDHYAVVQPFSQAIRLPRNAIQYAGEAEAIDASFASIYCKSDHQPPFQDYAQHGHTGYAWAARRELLDKHGLYDAAILGSADHFMAHAMCNRFEDACFCREMPRGSARWRHFMNWGQAFSEDVEGKIGYLPGVLLHLWHGSKADRNYSQRQNLLERSGFDPTTDLELDGQGTWKWGTSKSKLHEKVKGYFQKRCEDG